MVDREEVRSRIHSAISELRTIDNLHGITAENLRSFLVDPHEISVDPDDGVADSPKRAVWVVLEERPRSGGGYVVVFDPSDDSWGVAERAPAGDWVLVAGADSLEQALNSM